MYRLYGYAGPFEIDELHQELDSVTDRLFNLIESHSSDTDLNVVQVDDEG